MDDMERYDQFFLGFDEFTEKKYKRFFGTFKQYTYLKLNTSQAKSKKKDIGRYTRAFRFLIQKADKDLDSMTEEELYRIVLDKDAKSEHRRVLSRYYHFLHDKGMFVFENKLSCFGDATIKTEESFYTMEEWSNFVNMALEIDVILPRALRNVDAAKSWLYLILHMCLTWRKGDILSLPAMDNLIGIERYTLDWFGDNTFTLEDAGYIISNVKLYAEQYLTWKTNVKKHFHIPLSFYIPVSLAFIVTENWRRVQKQEKLFGTFNAQMYKLEKHFGKAVNGFSSLKANRTLLSIVDKKASEIGADELVRISSYMRAHKVDGNYFADQTLVYLKSSYSDKELQDATMMLYNRGMFGWMYNSFLESVSGEKNMAQEQKTFEIMELKKNLPIDELNEIAGILTNQRMAKKEVLDRILSLPQEEIGNIFEELHSGERVSNKEDIYCLKPEGCDNKALSDCYLCNYSIPTVHMLFCIKEELDEMFSEVDRLAFIYEYDRLRLIDKMLKLFTIIKEATETFGEVFVNSILPLEEFKNKLNMSYKKLRKESVICIN